MTPQPVGSLPSPSSFFLPSLDKGQPIITLYNYGESYQLESDPGLASLSDRFINFTNYNEFQSTLNLNYRLTLQRKRVRRRRNSASAENLYVCLEWNEMKIVIDQSQRNAGGVEQWASELTVSFNFICDWIIIKNVRFLFGLYFNLNLLYRDKRSKDVFFGRSYIQNILKAKLDLKHLFEDWILVQNFMYCYLSSFFKHRPIK